MRDEHRKKINYTSKETILEFKLRKDAHYKSQVLDPAASQLSSDELTSLKLFLPFFIVQRNYLQDRYLELAIEDAKKQNKSLFEEPNFDKDYHKNKILSLDEAKEKQKQKAYFAEYNLKDVQKLL